MKGVVSKETVVLRRWGSSIQKFGFINGVDKLCKLATVQRFLKLTFRALALRQSESKGLTLETSAFRISVLWPIYSINSVDKTKFQLL